jgi:single-stranded DNA-binding protein
VTVFGRRGESIAQYLLKGTRVVVAGRFQHRHFTRQDGSPGCALEVIATDIDFASSTRPESTPAAGSSQPTGPRAIEEVLTDEDVPF